MLRAGALLLILAGPATAAASTGPQAITQATTGVSTMQATLNGIVIPGDVATTWHFDWGLDAGYGFSSVEQATREATGGQTVDVTVTALVPGTTYHYRLVATDGSGASAAGADATFTTPSPPAPHVGRALPGRRICVVPNLLGVEFVAAQRLLASRGCRVGRLRRMRQPRRRRALIVFRQAPGEGTAMPTGGQVAIDIRYVRQPIPGPRRRRGHR